MSGRYSQASYEEWMRMQSSGSAANGTGTVIQDRSTFDQAYLPVQAPQQPDIMQLPSYDDSVAMYCRPQTSYNDENYNDEKKRLPPPSDCRNSYYSDAGPSSSAGPSRSSPYTPSATTMTSGQGLQQWQSPYAPSPQGTPGYAPSPSPSGLAHLKALAPGSSPSKLLTPPPPCFLRGIPARASAASYPFAPLVLMGLGVKVQDGFPAVAPPSNTQPHPFVVYDVGEADWTLFLNHVKQAGGLTPVNRIVAGVVPTVLGAGLVSGFIMSAVMEKHMKKGKVGPMAEIVDQWNYNFFYPRQLEVTLAQGYQQRSGFSENPLPDMPNAGPRRYRRSSSGDDLSSSSSDSSSDSDGRSRRGAWRREYNNGLLSGKRERKAARRARKSERRARKAERRAARRDGLRPDTSAERWRLIVSYKPLSQSQQGY